MTTVRVPPPRSLRFGDTRGCTGMTMEDGTVYRANRSGSVDVERGDHLEAMRRDPNHADEIMMPGFRGIGSKQPGTVCPNCHFRGWAWQHECPRCGTEMKAEADDDAG